MTSRFLGTNAEFQQGIISNSMCDDDTSELNRNLPKKRQCTSVRTSGRYRKRRRLYVDSSDSDSSPARLSTPSSPLPTSGVRVNNEPFGPSHLDQKQPHNVTGLTMKFHLWDESFQCIVDGEFNAAQALMVMETNEHVSIYIGQDIEHFPKSIFDIFVHQLDFGRWMNERQIKLPSQQRVMLLDTRSGLCYPFDLSPKLSELKQFFMSDETSRCLSRYLRPFCALHTLCIDLPPDLQHKLKTGGQNPYTFKPTLKVYHDSNSHNSEPIPQFMTEKASSLSSLRPKSSHHNCKEHHVRRRNPIRLNSSPKSCARGLQASSMCLTQLLETAANTAEKRDLILGIFGSGNKGNGLKTYSFKTQHSHVDSSFRKSKLKMSGVNLDISKTALKRFSLCGSEGSSSDNDSIDCLLEKFEGPACNEKSDQGQAKDVEGSLSGMRSPVSPKTLDANQNLEYAEENVHLHQTKSCDVRSNVKQKTRSHLSSPKSRKYSMERDDTSNELIHVALSSQFDSPLTTVPGFKGPHESLSGSPLYKEGILSTQQFYEDPSPAPGKMRQFEKDSVLLEKSEELNILGTSQRLMSVSPSKKRDGFTGPSRPSDCLEYDQTSKPTKSELCSSTVLPVLPNSDRDTENKHARLKSEVVERPFGKCPSPSLQICDAEENIVLAPGNSRSENMQNGSGSIGMGDQVSGVFKAQECILHQDPGNLESACLLRSNLKEVERNWTSTRTDDVVNVLNACRIKTLKSSFLVLTDSETMTIMGKSPGSCNNRLNEPECVDTLAHPGRYSTSQAAKVLLRTDPNPLHGSDGTTQVIKSGLLSIVDNMKFKAITGMIICRRPKHASDRQDPIFSTSGVCLSMKRLSSPGQSRIGLTQVGASKRTLNDEDFSRATLKTSNDFGAEWSRNKECAHRLALAKSAVEDVEGPNFLSRCTTDAKLEWAVVGNMAAVSDSELFTKLSITREPLWRYCQSSEPFVVPAHPTLLRTDLNCIVRTAYGSVLPYKIPDITGRGFAVESLTSLGVINKKNIRRSVCSTRRIREKQMGLLNMLFRVLQNGVSSGSFEQFGPITITSHFKCAPLNRLGFANEGRDLDRFKKMDLRTIPSECNNPRFSDALFTMVSNEENGSFTANLKINFGKQGQAGMGSNCLDASPTTNFAELSQQNDSSVSSFSAPTILPSLNSEELATRRGHFLSLQNKPTRFSSSIESQSTKASFKTSTILNVESAQNTFASPVNTTAHNALSSDAKGHCFRRPLQPKSCNNNETGLSKNSEYNVVPLSWRSSVWYNGFSTQRQSGRYSEKSELNLNSMGFISGMIMNLVESAVSYCNQKKLKIPLRLPLVRWRRKYPVFDANDKRKCSQSDSNSKKRVSQNVNKVVSKIQTEVYSWDAVKKERSRHLIPIKELVAICTTPSGSSTVIYDGQDFNFDDSRLSGHFPILSREKDSFANENPEAYWNRKVRLWDMSKRDMVRHRDSPILSSLGMCLRAHPTFRVFQFEFVMLALNINIGNRSPQSCSLRMCLLPSRVHHSVKRPVKLATLLKNILLKISQTGVAELPNSEQRKIALWNTKTLQIETMDFPTRSDLTVHLLQNPTLELATGQDKIYDLERRTGFHLIPVYLNCPAKLSIFWNKVAKKICAAVPNDSSKDIPETIADYINKLSSFEVYVGQDLEEARLIAETIKRRSRLGKFPYTYMLGCCGTEVQQHVYDKQWMPCYINHAEYPCKFAVFWNRQSATKCIGPEREQSVTVQMYLDECEEMIEIYQGQDLSTSVQIALKNWFETLRFEPGSAGRHKVPALLPIAFKCSFRSGNVRNVLHLPAISPVPRRCASERSHSDETNHPLKRQRISFDLTENRAGESSRGNGRKRGFEQQYGSTQEAFLTREINSSDKEGSGLVQVKQKQKQKIGVLLVNHTCFDDDQSPSYKTSLEGRVSSNSRRGKEKAIFELDGKDEHANQNRALPAHKRLKHMMDVIKEAGPKILRKGLAMDLRQSLRERLMLEAESVDELNNLVQKIDGIDIAGLAFDLSGRLVALDVYSCFSDDWGSDFGPESLLSLTKKMQCGEICTISEVITHFREVCLDLMSYYEHSSMSNEVSAVLRNGEELISVFTSFHKEEMNWETKMMRVHTLCEQGIKIGFKKCYDWRRTIASEQLKVSEKGSLHVSGTGPEVTYMNYRDEKGNSVMGKQQSVRVMGMSIDTKECERRIGQIRKCHLCRKMVSESSGELLKCSNSAFGICNEAICQGCVEAELEMEFEEFSRVRTIERWFCNHCCGNCPKGSICLKNSFENELQIRTRSVELWWELGCVPASRVSLSILRRSLDGKYEGLWRELELRKIENSRKWTRKVSLELGAYRCNVIIDGSKLASTTFQVFPPKARANPVSMYSSIYEDAKGQTEAGGLDIDGAIQAKETENNEGRDVEPVLLGKAWIESQKKKSGSKRIEWEKSRNCFIGSSYVKSGRSHSFGDEQGGKMIKNCSRTEGFDWRRAKHYSIAQWIPEQVGGDITSNQDCLRNNTDEIVYCANDWVSEELLKRRVPKVRKGTSWRQININWNSMMYNKMLKSVWGIVTGRSEIHGIGLFTLTGYERGDMVIEYAGSVIRTPLGDIREKEYQSAGLGTYLFKLNDYEIVDATVRSNRARFTNHSCDPNMIADVITIHGRELVVLRAIRRIPKYSELTFDYKLPYEEDEKLPCLCNSSNCVGVMN